MVPFLFTCQTFYRSKNWAVQFMHRCVCVFLAAAAEVVMDLCCAAAAETGFHSREMLLASAA